MQRSEVLSRKISRYEEIKEQVLNRAAGICLDNVWLQSNKDEEVIAGIASLQTADINRRHVKIDKPLPEKTINLFDTAILPGDKIYIDGNQPEQKIAFVLRSEGDYSSIRFASRPNKTLSKSRWFNLQGTKEKVLVTDNDDYALAVDSGPIRLFNEEDFESFVTESVDGDHFTTLTFKSSVIRDVKFLHLMGARDAGAVLKKSARLTGDVLEFPAADLFKFSLKQLSGEEYLSKDREEKRREVESLEFQDRLEIAIRGMDINSIFNVATDTVLKYVDSIGKFINIIYVERLSKALGWAPTKSIDDSKTLDGRFGKAKTIEFDFWDKIGERMKDGFIKNTTKLIARKAKLISTHRPEYASVESPLTIGYEVRLGFAGSGKGYLAEVAAQDFRAVLLDLDTGKLEGVDRNSMSVKFMRQLIGGSKTLISGTGGPQDPNLNAEPGSELGEWAGIWGLTGERLSRLKAENLYLDGLPGANYIMSLFRLTIDGKADELATNIVGDVYPFNDPQKDDLDRFRKGLVESFKNEGLYLETTFQPFMITRLSEDQNKFLIDNRDQVKGATKFLKAKLNEINAKASWGESFSEQLESYRVEVIACLKDQITTSELNRSEKSVASMLVADMEKCVEEGIAKRILEAGKSARPDDMPRFHLVRSISALGSIEAFLSNKEHDLIMISNDGDIHETVINLVEQQFGSDDPVVKELRRRLEESKSDKKSKTEKKN